jgi:hypothetical protein
LHGGGQGLNWAVEPKEKKRDLLVLSFCIDLVTFDKGFYTWNKLEMILQHTQYFVGSSG